MFDEAVELHDGDAGTLSDTRFTATVEQGGVRTLSGRHRVNHRLDGLERIVAHFDTFEGFVHAGNHTHQVLHRTHLLYLRKLTEEVVEVELVMGNAFADTACLRLVVLFLRALHKADHVTHSEDSVRHTSRMEHIERFHLLARTDELNRLIDHRTDGQRRTAAGIAV